MTRRSYAGAAVETTTTGSVAGSGAVTVAIASSTGWPDGSGGKFAIVVDPGQASEEKMLVTSRSGLNLTVASGDRGYDGTSAQAHSSGAVVYLTVTAVDLDEANAHVNGTSGSHAATAISNTPAGNIAATTVQAAINELDTEKAAASHTQASSTITDFTEAVQDVVGALLAGSGLASVSYNDGAGTLTITVSSISQTSLASTLRLPYIVTSGTRPGSPTEGDVIYETDTNRSWRYNGSAWRWVSGTAPTCSVVRTSAHSLSNNSITAVPFVSATTTELTDTDSIHEGVTNPTRFTVPSALPGMWRFTWTCTYAANATGTRAGWFEKNQNGTSGGTRYAKRESPVNSGSNDTTIGGTVDLNLTASDYVEFFAYQNSGGSLGGFGTNAGDMISAVYLGPVD